jgi:putative flippase GtrA
MIWKKRTNHRTNHLVIQFLVYMISGGAYFWSGYALFALLWSDLGWSLWWAKLAANLFGWTINFFLQRYWVFNNASLKSRQTQVTGRYIFITLVDFMLDYGIVASLKTASITPYVGQFVSAGFFTAWNYCWNRFWVFPENLAGKKAPTTPTPLVTHGTSGRDAYHEEAARGK